MDANRRTKYVIGAVCVGVVIAMYAVWTCRTAVEGACIVAAIKQHPGMFVIGLLACLGVGGIGALLVLQQLRSYGAALIATAAFLPGAATLLTILIFLAPWTLSCEGKYAPFQGSGIALVSWIVVSLFCLRFTDAKHAIPSSYGELCQRLAQLKSQLSVVCTGKTFPADPCMSMACSEADKQLQKIRKELGKRGLPWALARGYINVWGRLLRAEEAMIEVAPKETVIAGALNDLLRLQGSRIDHSDDLMARLRQAIEVIDPSAKIYLQGATATPLPLVITTPSPLAAGAQLEPYAQNLAVSGGTLPVTWALSQSTLPDGLALSAAGVISGTPTKSDSASFTVRVTDGASVTATKAFTLTITPQSVAAAVASARSPASAVAAPVPGDSTYPQAQARAVLRDVRYAINEYRDGRWNGLIVARNRLIATMMFTGVTAYVLLAIAIICGAQKTEIAAASAFYLVGATIGLLNQLRSNSQNDSAVEDYGLSSARLITMPLFCGLAAIGGVVIMAMPQMISSNATILPQLEITTPSQLSAGVYDKLYHQKIDAAGGSAPYSWTANSDKLLSGMELKTTGDLIARLPKKPDPPQRLEPVIFTAHVKDSTGATAEKPFFLSFTSSIKAPAETQHSSKVASTSPSSLVRPLQDIFDLNKNIIGLLLAAVFGLTPGLLFDRLQQQSEKFKSELKSSEATQAKAQTNTQK